MSRSTIQFLNKYGITHVRYPSDQQRSELQPCHSPKPFKKRTSIPTKRFEKCMSKLEGLYLANRYDDYLALRQGELNSIYKYACALLRDADNANARYRVELLEIVRPIIDEAIMDERDADVGCLTLRPQDYGKKPITVEDKRVKRDPTASGMDSKPHLKSSPFANFGLTLAELTATPINPSAMCVYDARCEIELACDHQGSSGGRSYSDVASKMQVSAGGSCLAVAGWISLKVARSRGYQREGKFPAPWVAYHFPDNPKSKFHDFMGNCFDTGLAGTPGHMALDEDQRLIFVADEERVKSFAWAAPNGSYHSKPLATHPLSPARFDGPMSTLPNGTLARAGMGAAAIRDLKQLKTHGSKGKKLIGETMSIDDECEHSSDFDDVPHFEYSSGSNPTSIVKFANDRKLFPDMWQAVPHSPSVVLAAGYNEYNCVTIDLEHGGKTICRYRGHPYFVTDLSVSAADPHVFLTSGHHNRFARLFDTQQPRVVLRFPAGGKGGRVALAHPAVFTSYNSRRDFMVWDVRSRACVYELGVNEYSGATLKSLAWDSTHNTLFSLKSIPGEKEECSKPRYSDEYFDDDERPCYNRIYRYSFKDTPEFSLLRTDDSKADHEAFSGADSDVLDDDSDSDIDFEDYED